MLSAFTTALVAKVMAPGLGYYTHLHGFLLWFSLALQTHSLLIFLVFPPLRQDFASTFTKQERLFVIPFFEFTNTFLQNSSAFLGLYSPGYHVIIYKKFTIGLGTEPYAIYIDQKQFKFKNTALHDTTFNLQPV